MTRRLEAPEDGKQRLEREALSDRERAELWTRVAQSTSPEASMRRRLKRWTIPLAVNAVATALVLWMAWSWMTPEDPPVAKPETVDPCALDPNASELRLPDACASREVQVNGDGWQLEQGAAVVRAADGARVERGRVRFRVRPRSAQGDKPFVVRVSHAEVRVIGTVFVIDQGQSRGTVTVSEGVVEVVWHDGSRQRVAAGQSASWPRATPTPAPEAKAPDAGIQRADSRTPATPDLEQVMERLLLLRSQKRHGEAVALLKKTLATKGMGAVQRERISYELGLALDASGAPSCPHWREHVGRFGTARNTRTLEARLARCERE
jgi:hypothetical protein